MLWVGDEIVIIERPGSRLIVVIVPRLSIKETSTIGFHTESKRVRWGAAFEAAQYPNHFIRRPRIGESDGVATNLKAQVIDPEISAL